MPTNWGDPQNIVAIIAVAVQTALVIVGIFTLLAIRREAGKTAQSAEAALRSVKIQEAQLQQWFGVTNWLSQYRTREDGSKELAYGLNITNPTDMPLDVRHITIRSTATRSDLAFGALLIPPKESFEITNADPLDNESVGLYRGSGLPRTYEITVQFTNPFRPEETITRAQTYLCAFRLNSPKVDVRLQPSQARDCP